MTKVEMLYPQGYCAGVKNAITLALQTKANNMDKNVYIMGNLVHNKEVINSLSNQGIITLTENEENFETLLRKLDKNSIVIFPAHGHDEKYDLMAKEIGLEVLDAVCPKVKQNASIIKEEIKNGHQVIYIGMKKHPETLACLSIDENVKLYDVNETFNFSIITDRSPLAINQTTLNFQELSLIHNKIREVIPNTRFQNEICNSTRRRQEVIVSLPDTVDLIVVVGDKSSSNTNRLLEIAKTTHPNAEAILIDNVGQINKENIINKNHIAIASGASTPIEIINMVYFEIVDCFAK